MTRYLLHTSIASHVIKGDVPRVREQLARLPMESVAVSVVTQAELLYGVAGGRCNLCRSAGSGRSR